tara:strand:+ start:69 stop:239 length:171 start_codon:yes stop_codon:yes gene_type:complete
LLHKKQRKADHRCANYKGINFTFRRSDVSAVEEILYADEYDFLESLVENKGAVTKT